jgi:PIN domain nuclease of toxin-antitoxin system
MKYLLDTCTFLWFISSDKELPHSLRELICSAENEIYLSSVTYWEILIKENLGKMKFPLPANEYIITQRKNHLIDALPLEEESIQYLSKLPHLHRDPFDRMLVCQSIHHAMPIITPDDTLSAYPIRTIWTENQK